MAGTFGIDPGEGHHTSISMFEDYPAQTARLSGKERKGIKSTAKALFETSPSDAISYLAGQRGYTNFRPDLLMGKLMSKPVDYDRFKIIGSNAFQDLLGRSMSDTDWTQASQYAKAMGVKDPNAFESLLSKRIASTPEGAAKLKSEADYVAEAQYGTMTRDPQGNLNRGQYLFRPELINSAVQQMLGRS